MEGGIAGGAAGGTGCVGPASDSQSTVDDGSGVSPCVSEADIGLMMPGDGGDRGDFSPRDHSKVRHTPHTVALSKAAVTLCEVSGCCCRSNWCQIQRVFCVLTAACVIDDVPLIPAPISQLSGHLYSPPPHPLAILIHSPSSSTRHPHPLAILIHSSSSSNCYRCATVGYAVPVRDLLAHAGQVGEAQEGLLLLQDTEVRPGPCPFPYFPFHIYFFNTQRYIFLPCFHVSGR